MLELGDRRWLTLGANERDGRYVTQWLRRLLDEPDNIALFMEDESASLCSLEITWSLAFGAAPHLVEVARRAQANARVHYVHFLGAIAIYRLPHDQATDDERTRCPDDLEVDFGKAMLAARDMAIALIPFVVHEVDARGLFAAIAAFQGFGALGRRIIDIELSGQAYSPPDEIEF
ncbi:MAG TPA: hypothetical protein VHR72_11960 [Gemmataceae bacterium]|nr:hypothetical protein [Gemmataceae bacterium]